MTLLAPVTIWVDESSYEAARAIVIEIQRNSSLERRAEWEEDWRTKFGGSYSRWLLAKLRKPANIGRIIFLGIMLAIFVVYPIVYVLRH